MVAKQRLLSIACYGNHQLARTVDSCLSHTESTSTVLQAIDQLLKMSKELPDPTPGEGMATFLAYHYNLFPTWRGLARRYPPAFEIDKVPLAERREWVAGTEFSRLRRPVWLRANTASDYTLGIFLGYKDFYLNRGLYTRRKISYTTAAVKTLQQLYQSPTELLLDEFQPLAVIEDARVYRGLPQRFFFAKSRINAVYSLLRRDCLLALSECGLPTDTEYLMDVLDDRDDSYLNLWKHDLVSSAGRNFYLHPSDRDRTLAQLMDWYGNPFSLDVVGPTPLLSRLLRDASSPQIQGFLYSVILAFPTELGSVARWNQVLLEWLYNALGNSVSPTYSNLEARRYPPPDVKTLLFVRNEIHTALRITDRFLREPGQK
ncbi:hypothetical protein BRCON_2302 [Candidatus Sumerlaea chitinivorans]|uniref:Uncharacterized protein n=1 Tax=Sumerlaea chitinivorans TaxID=2250252 RepID=A0A2Z4Y872_SUMC1|nr:hypothetical protein BRCON_2302 [Candidatus Sumerlaea chitinivorans]